MLPDTLQNLISSRSSFGQHVLKNIVKIHALVEAVEDPQMLKPQNIQSDAMATVVA